MKAAPEDFVVEEIVESGAVIRAGMRYGPEALGMKAHEDGRFCAFVMQKRMWNTVQALSALAKRLGRSIRSAGWAGTKDRISVSTQLCSMFGASPQQVELLQVKDISINGAWLSDSKVRLGELRGNRFSVLARTDDAEAKDCADAICSELNGVFPNYYGAQRFGSRGNNVKVGMHIIKGEFEEAAMEFLAGTSGESMREAVEARQRLERDRDFAAALEYFPSHLKYERLVLRHLARCPTDYANALRRLPRGLSLMFVHAVEAYLFNEELTERVRSGAGAARGDGDIVCSADAIGFPEMRTANLFNASSPEEGELFVLANVIGYGSKLNDAEARLLERHQMEKEMFRVAHMPELGSKGALRPLFAPYVDMRVSIEERGALFSFSLPAGSYATVLLNEFVEQAAEQRDGNRSHQGSPHDSNEYIG